MKKTIALLFILITVFVAGCSQKATVKNTVEGNFRTYYEMGDGTFQCENNLYKHRIEISGRMPNGAKDTTFVYLSNIEDISFEKAWKAAGFSSNSEDYFSKEEAVLVELY